MHCRYCWNSFFICSDAITTGAVDASVCAGSTISVPFTTTGTVGTDFTVQLSDASGAFTAPVAIGTGTASPLSATIPFASVAGSAYKMRVVTLTPSIIGDPSVVFAIKELPAAPTGADFYRLCVGGTPVTLTAAGQNLKWYAYDAQGGSQALSAAPTINPTSSSAPTSPSYNVRQTVNGCEGAKLDITVAVSLQTPTPVITQPAPVCQNSAASNTILTNSITGPDTHLWYETLTGPALTVAPTPSTAVVGSQDFYVSEVASRSCESAKVKVTVTVVASPNAPTVTNKTYTVNDPSVAPLSVSSSTGTLKWYETATSTTALAGAPTPSVTAAGTKSYFVSQTVGDCESARAEIVVTVNVAACTTPAAPVVVTPLNYTVGQTATLTATAISGATLNWYGTNASGGTASATASVPSTAAVGSTTYYVSQSVGTCESPRSAIVVNVAAAPCTTPAAPVVVTPLNYTVGQTATLTATAISGATLNWYGTNVSGGIASATAPVPSTAAVGSTTYYVSQSVGTCESPRSAIIVNVAAAPCTTPAAPVVVTPLNYTVGQTATLTATAISGATLNWYGTNVSGGIASATAPVPSTAAVGTTTYYVSQSVGSCESPRSAIVVNVAAALYNTCCACGGYTFKLYSWSNSNFDCNCNIRCNFKLVWNQCNGWNSISNCTCTFHATVGVNNLLC